MELALAAGLGGSLLGALGLGATPYRPPRAVLTIFASNHLEPGWQGLLGTFWAVCPRFVSGSTLVGNFEKMAAISDQAAQVGKDRQGWGYHYCRTMAEATAEGETAGRVSSELGLSIYYWNAEHQWGGAHSPGHPRYEPGADDPIGTSIAFAEAFHRAAGYGTRLAWNAYTTEAARWFGSRHLALDVPANVALFEVWAPMIYASGAEQIAKKWKTRAGKWPGMIDIPMVGTGRLLSTTNPQAGPGVCMGYAFDTDGAPGLLSLSAESRPDGIAYFYGNGSAGMLTQGNWVNPPLPELNRALKADRGLGIA